MLGKRLHEIQRVHLRVEEAIFKSGNFFCGSDYIIKNSHNCCSGIVKF